MSPCIFCKIVNGEAPSETYYEDDEIIVFKDIQPASTFHFLVIPKEHIPGVNDLTSEHKRLVQKMIDCGKNVLVEKSGDGKDVRLGFHLPPFNSVKHLHLHVISPAVPMSMIHRIIFKPNTWWFSTADQVLEKLDTKCSKL